ncbi:MAG: hypothetical protein C0392_06515 [Syntrophus sp. (in: bacteria)]|nr:hypothetical protein [Syntrophus sp. (in: bacteria)]
MSNIAEFIEIRKSIEALARQIIVCVEQNATQDSRKHLDEASRQLEILKTMVANDVQVIVAGRLSRQLIDLGTKVEKMKAKSPTGKRPAGKKATGKKEKIPVKPSSGEEPVIVVFERP